MPLSVYLSNEYSFIEFSLRLSVLASKAVVSCNCSLQQLSFPTFYIPPKMPSTFCKPLNDVLEQIKILFFIVSRSLNDLSIELFSLLFSCLSCQIYFGSPFQFYVKKLTLQDRVANLIVSA